MKTTGYEPAESCSSLRFEQFDRKCYKAFGINQLFDSIAESDLLSNSSEKPWGGYAQLKNGSRLEWVNFYGTYTECTNALKRVTVDDPIIFYTAPTGCAYNGNSYWRVWIMNALWGGSELGCIAVGGELKRSNQYRNALWPSVGATKSAPRRLQMALRKQLTGERNDAKNHRTLSVLGLSLENRRMR